MVRSGLGLKRRVGGGFFSFPSMKMIHLFPSFFRFEPSKVSRQPAKEKIEARYACVSILQGKALFLGSQAEKKNPGDTA